MIASFEILVRRLLILLVPILGLIGIGVGLIQNDPYFIYSIPQHQILLLHWPIVIVILPTVVLSVYLLKKIKISTRHLRALEFTLLLSLAFYYFLFEISGDFGDDFYYQLYKTDIASSPALNYANALGSELLFLIFNMGANVNLYSSFSGLLTAFFIILYLNQLESLSKFPPGPESILARLAILASGIHISFLRNYLEVSQISFPIGILSLMIWTHYCEKSSSNLAYFLGTFSYYVAIATHGLWICIMPAWMWISAIARDRDSFAIRLAKFIGIPVLGAILVVAITKLLPLLGMETLMAEVYGGGDGSNFVPLAETKYFGIPFEAWYLMLSKSHLAELASRYLIFAPIALITLILGLFHANFDFLKQIDDRRFRWLGITTLGVTSFGVIHHFDLGLVGDYDLLALTYFPLWLLGIEFLYVNQTISNQAKTVIVIISILLSTLATVRFSYFSPLGGETPSTTRYSCHYERRCQ